MPRDTRQRMLRATASVRNGVRKHVRPGLRWVVGLLLIVGGIFGFLPILGFWMIPLGIGIAALDLKPAWQWLQGKRKR